jgi:hypothetical protein
MKRYLIALITGALLVGGVTAASGSPTPAPPPKPSADLGDQTNAVSTPVPLAIGSKNATIKREYTQLATACRLYDSRSTTRLASNSTRTIPLTKCPAIPSYATSLTVSLSAITPTHAGYLRAWANGAAEPSQTVLQWGSSSTTTGANITMSSSGVKVHSFGGPVDLVVDVAGYWNEAIYADILTASTTQFADMYTSTGMISGYSSSLASPGQIVVSVRRDILYCDIQATAESAGYIASAVYTSSNSFVVRVTDSNGAAARAYASVVVNC